MESQNQMSDSISASSISFMQNIRKAFPYLFEKWGFEIVDLVDDYGGSLVVAQSDVLIMRFVCDRADFFLDIGRSGTVDQLLGFYDIVNRLKASGRVKTEYKYINKIKPVSRLLEQYFSEIREFYLE